MKDNPCYQSGKAAVRIFCTNLFFEPFDYMEWSVVAHPNLTHSPTRTTSAIEPEIGMVWEILGATRVQRSINRDCMIISTFGLNFGA